MRGWKSVEGPGVVARRRRDVRRWAKRPLRRRIWGAEGQSRKLGSGHSVYRTGEDGNEEILHARRMASS